MTSPEEKLLYAALAKSPSMFVEKCYNEIDGSYEYNETIASKLILDKLKIITEATEKRQIINVPPRCYKSTIISIAYTAWLLGQNPKLKILCISYGDDLAKDFSIKVRQIMKSDWYKKTFPKTRLKLWGQKDDHLETTKNGYRRAASIGGSLTGRGADIIIIDDPQKAQDILSERKRKTSNETFASTIISRMNDKTKCKIIVVAQRLHMDDFSGYVQKYGKWDVLAIPAIAEKDETYTLSDGSVINRKAGSVINPTTEPLEYLLEIREGMGDFHFSAQYQQKPIPEEGNIIKFKDFLLYDTIPSTNDMSIVQSWDMAEKPGKNNDFSVCVTAAICNNITYILDIERYKLEYTDLLNQVKYMRNKHSAQAIIIEDIGQASAIVKQLRSEGIGIIADRPTLSKTIRAAAITYKIRAGEVRLPKSAKWIKEFEDEISSFPFGRNDDQVDAFTQLVSNVQDGLIVPSMPIIMFDDDEEADEETKLLKWLLGD